MKILAQPFEVIDNDEHTFERIAGVISEKNIERIILGYPYNDENQETVVTRKIGVFKKTLEKRFGLPVILVDERFSSSMASDRILQSVPKKMKRRDKSRIDIGAAVILLEDYLRSGSVL